MLLDELANIGLGDISNIDSLRNLILMCDIIDGKLQVILMTLAETLVPGSAALAAWVPPG
jgi:hypothetical protein